MAASMMYLYRNYNDSDYTYNSSHSAAETLPSVAELGWERDGYTFVEWNTSRDGTGTSYEAGGYPNPMGGTLYAIWASAETTTTPLTDSINALTTYANGVTGASDTTLSAAVATLVAGYGGGGGASNVVTGTFTGTTTGSAMSVSLNYTGNGYPIVVLIYPVDGIYNSSSDYYSLLQRFAVGMYCILKNYPATSPTYTGSGDANKDLNLLMYKSSASVSNLYSSSNNINGTNYNSASAISSTNSCVRINSATQLSVFIADTSYGFAANIAYKYWVIYSE